MNTNQSMIGFVKESVKNPDDVKLMQFGKEFTAKQVFADIACVSTYLKHNGVKKGDSVIICLPNIAQAVVALYAINAVGAIANIVHPKIGTDGLIKIAKNTDTKWIFIFDMLFVKHRKALSENKIRSIVCRISDWLSGKKILREAVEPTLRSRYATSYNSALVRPTAFDVEVFGDDAAVYLHSSGTTGEPKTVILSNRALNELAKSIAARIKPAEGSSMLMTLPMFHGFGLGVCVHLVMTAGKIVLLPVFRAKKAVRLIGRTQINYMALVPSMLRKLLDEKKFSGKRLLPLKQIFVGGDKLNEELRLAAVKRMEESGSKCRICEGFGLSESASVTHINTDGKGGGTVGRPLDGVKVKIMNGDVEADIGADGEIWISSDAMMSGYLGAEADFVLDDEGVRWLKTGDIGRVDGEGFLYYRGRQKRMIKIGGVNIYPQEIEEIVTSLPEVKDACAVRTEINGKPAVRLLVETRAALTPELEKKLKRAVETNLLPYAVPRSIERVSDFKRTSLGKTDYKYYEELQKQ